VIRGNNGALAFDFVTGWFGIVVLIVAHQLLLKMVCVRLVKTTTRFIGEGRNG
jgi:hypothetical protein